MKVLLFSLVLLGIGLCQLPGGVEQHAEATKLAMDALNAFLIKFIENAGSCINSDTDKIVIGEIENLDKQVVAGQKYIITLPMGITDRCNDVTEPSKRIQLASGDEKYNSMIIDVGQCAAIKNEKIGRHKLTVVDQPWMKEHYTYFEFDDLDEGKTLKSVWDHEKNELKSVTCNAEVPRV